MFWEPPYSEVYGDSEKASCKASRESGILVLRYDVGKRESHSLWSTSDFSSPRMPFWGVAYFDRRPDAVLRAEYT